MWSVSTELVLGGVAGMAKPAGRFSWPTATGQRQWDSGQLGWKAKSFICSALESPFGVCPSSPIFSTSQHTWQANKYK